MEKRPHKRVAFVHDWFTIPGGAEKVAEQIIDLLRPSAIFSLFNFMDFKTAQKITGGKGIRTSFLQQIPGAQQHYRFLAPLFPQAVSRLDVSKFDIIISSSWMAAKGIQKQPGQRHISYCHTPMRFAWDLEDTYLHKYDLGQGWKGWVSKWLIKRLRKWDVETAENVDFFIANSEFVAKRIERAYGRKSVVIHPPVNTEQFTLHENKEDYYFIASRLVDYKNIDLVLKAFQRLPDKKLLIAGTGPLQESLKKQAPSNVRFLGWLTEQEIVSHMQRAKAFINASVEDFGIAGLEAQSCGTPVIALGKGGYCETIIENETGILFHREHPEALADAILRLERMEFDPSRIRAHAKRFDQAFFNESFLNFFLDKCFDRAKTMA